LAINTCMSSYSLQATSQSSHTPNKLTRGPIRIWSAVPIYWVIGENPVAQANGCARLAAGQVLELRLPTSCARLAVLAVNEHGSVTVTEVSGGARASCSL
jgi:hypothetical protein